MLRAEGLEEHVGHLSRRTDVDDVIGEFLRDTCIKASPNQGERT
jgi:hypothetical protein